MLTVRKVQGRSHLIFYLILSSVTLLLGIIDLSLPVWLSYCWWDFGLFNSKNTSRIKDFKSSQSISSLHSDVCGSLESYVDRSCPDACDSLHSLSKAGYIMVVFGSLALCSNFFSIIAVALKLLKRKVPKILHISFVLPFILWLFGFSIYAGVAGLGRYKEVVNKSRFNFEADNYSIKVGGAIGVTMIFLYLISGAYALFVLRRLVIGLK
jgi:hypothetical protein